MLIIGFGNKSRHGKDTAAEAIVDFYKNQNELLCLHGLKGGQRVQIFKFATALYQEVNEAIKYGIWQSRVVDKEWKYHVALPDWVQPDPNPEISELAPYGKHPKLLQFWGTEFRRAEDPDYWVKKLFASIPADTNIALISDVRFPNEAEAITSRGGYNVNVQRMRANGTYYFSHDRPTNHESEIAMDSYNWQFRLTNHDGHQALLAEQAITLAEYLRSLK